MLASLPSDSCFLPHQTLLLQGCPPSGCGQGTPVPLWSRQGLCGTHMYVPYLHTGVTHAHTHSSQPRASEGRGEWRGQGRGPSSSRLPGARAVMAGPARSVLLGCETRRARPPLRRAGPTVGAGQLCGEAFTPPMSGRAAVSSARNDSPLASVPVQCPDVGTLSVPGVGGWGTH